MEKTALLFPGQGSQFVGMGKSLYDRFPEAREIFRRANAVLPDAGLSVLCFNGPEEILRLTMNAQAAIFTVSMLSHAIFTRLGQTAHYAAGHSVGEYGALAAAGVFSFEDGLRLVRKRGELMYQAGLSKPGTMTAVLGMSAEALEGICAEASSADATVEIANLNTPAQIVISGSPAAVERAGALARERGAKRVVPLPVSGAFHSALMDEAATALGRELDKVPFGEAAFPVVANLTAKPVTHGNEIRTLLKKQIRGKVMWEQTIRFLIGEGVTRFVEMEPGSVLCGLVRSIDRQAKTLTLEQILAASEQHAPPLSRE